VSALGPIPLGVTFVPDSNDSSHGDEEDSDEALVHVDELASELSGVVAVVAPDTGVNDGRVDPAEASLRRALLDRSKAANTAASLGVDDPSSLKTESEEPSGDKV